MATKTSTIYSTNPKMDTSGITAKQPGVSPVIGTVNIAFAPREVTGGTLYLAGLAQQENFCKDHTITRPGVMRKAAKLVGKGVSPKFAMDILEDSDEAEGDDD